MSVYKSEQPEHLELSLKSVWTDQTLKPTQIILIEDGLLNEGLYNVISKYKELLGEKLCIYKNNKNLGLTKSLNIGLKAVTSDFVARMDSDDISEPKRFERQVNFLLNHPDIDVIGGALQEFDSKNDCLNIRYYPLTHEEVIKYIKKASPLAHPAVMMRNNIFQKGLKYDERYPTSQDLQLWFDVITAGYKIANLPDVVLFFRREKDVFKRRSRAKAKNEFKIYMHGIRRMEGVFTLSYIYPILRFLFRNMSIPMIRAVYNGRIREKLLQK